MGSNMLYLFKEDNKKNKKLNKKKILKIVVIIFLIIILTVMGLLYEKNDNIRNLLDVYLFKKEKIENNLPNIAIEQNSSVYAYDGKIAVLHHNSLKIYNKFGTLENDLEIEITNPIFSSNGGCLCIAEKWAQKIYVISGKNIIWQKNLEGNIVDVCINQNGYVAVNLSGTAYKNEIEVYDNSGTKLFISYIKSTYAVDMDISPNNRYLAIAEVNISGILPQSNIKEIAIEKVGTDAKDAIEYSYLAKEGDLIVNIEYNNKNELTCIYDNQISMMKNKENKVISDFTNEEVLFADLNDNPVRVVKKKNKEVEFQIMPYDNNAEKIRSYVIEEPKEMYVDKNITALNLGSEVLFINNNGWLVKKYKSTQEINKIVLCKGLAGIVYNSKIELISL